MTSRRFARPLVAVVVLVALVPGPASAFKFKSHIYISNIVMDDVVDGSVYLPGMVTMHRFQPAPGQTDDAALNLICDGVEPALACRAPTGAELAIRNDLLREAIFLYPEMVRGGSIGPDAFPDVIWGQQTAHVNHGRWVGDGVTQLREAFGGANQDDLYSGIPFLVLDRGSAGTHETFLPRFLRDADDTYTWRSVDFGVYLMGKAFAWHETFPRGSLEYHRRLQAIAFSFGYLMHIGGDANMHTVLNRQVGSAFDIIGGYGLFGGLSEEVKHVTAEALVDARMTPTLFIGPSATIDPLSNDPKFPGTNGVVAHGPIMPPAGLACPTAPQPRWAYCNPIDDSGRLTGSCIDRPENPYAAMACDPWRSICYSQAEVTAARQAIHEGLVKCAERAANSCGDPAPCRLTQYESALKDLPPTCDPEAIQVRRDGDGVIRERSNACIMANCAFDATRCPQQGLLGFEDRQAVAPPCSMDPDRFGVNRAAFLSGTEIATPIEFLYLTMIEDPRRQISDISTTYGPPSTIDHVRKRSVGGPYLTGLLDLRDELRHLAEATPEFGGLRGVSFDPARLGSTISALASSSTPAGRFLRSLGDGIQVLQDVGRVATCVLTLGLVCSQSTMDIPLFTPSLLLGRRAALIDEQLHRYLELSTCLAQNLTDGALTDAPILDRCNALRWYRENHRLERQARASLATHLGSPPATGPTFLERCLGVRDQRDEPMPPMETAIDHGRFSLTLQKIDAFLINDTMREVLSLHAEDLGIATPEFAQAIWIMLNVLVADYLTAPLSDVFNMAAGGMCNQIVAAGFPDVQAMGFAMQNLERLFGARNEELAVNIAFLREDALRDSAYRDQVRGILQAMTPPRGEQFDRLLTNPSVSPRDLAIEAQALVDALMRSPEFGALVGPKVAELRRYFGMDRTTTGDVTVNRALPIFNTIQLSKLVALGFQGIRGLETSANAIPTSSLPIGSVDTGPAILLHAARGGIPKEATLATDLASYSVVYEGGPAMPGKANELFDLWCGTVDYNLLCNAVSSLDDPDDYAHYGMAPGVPFAVVDASNQQVGKVGPQRDRSVVLDRIILEPGVPPNNLSFHVTNFAAGAPAAGPSTANVSRVFGNIMSPYYCNNPGTTLQARIDNDGDGIVDACDNCPALFNPGQEDNNLDAIGNVCDPSADDPPVPPPGGLLVPPENEHVGCRAGPDSDGDGVGDACDICPTGRDRDDADRDGVPDTCDDCPTTRSANTKDRDLDGTPDVCDLCPDVADSTPMDTDCDGVGDACDNCPRVANPSQDNVCESAGCCQTGGVAGSDAALILLLAGLLGRRRRSVDRPGERVGPKRNRPKLLA